LAMRCRLSSQCWEAKNGKFKGFFYV
jgi:hypothetical protein